MSSSDVSVDEEMIAREVKRIMAHDMSSATPEEKQLYTDLEARIASANAKMFGDNKAGSKKKSLKAKILAASSLARSREKATSQKILEPARHDELAAAEVQVAEKSEEMAQMEEAVKNKIKAAYKVTAPGNIRKQLEDDGDAWKHGGLGSDSDKEEEEEEGRRLAAVTGHSPLEKLQRSVRKAQLLAKATGGGDADSDEEVRALTQESEAWLRRQKELERQLLATSGKSALRNKYMNKELERGTGVGPTDKEIEELFEKVVAAPERGRPSAACLSSDMTPGGRPRQDMADVVRRAMALRAEAAKSKGRTPTTRRTARRAFPVQLDDDEAEGDENGSSEDDADEDDFDEREAAAALGIPSLATSTDSSEDEDESQAKRKAARNAPRFSLRQRSSFDLADMDDALSIENAKRQLAGMRAPRLAKGDPLSRSFDAPLKGPKKPGPRGDGKTTIEVQPRSARPEMGRPLIMPAVPKGSSFVAPTKPTSAAKGVAKVPAAPKGTTAKGTATSKTHLAKPILGARLGSAKSKESIPTVVNGKRTVTAGAAKPIIRSGK